MTERSIFFVGHIKALREVQESFASGRMPHAWLITGTEGIGKATFAKQVAQFVLANGAGEIGKLDPQHSVAKQVEAESHPDLLIVRRPLDEKTGLRRDIIPVEDVLKIGQFLHKTSTHGGWRVVILDEAHALNRHGQNAILKSVEEPPPNTLILITVTTPGVLLPTIRSRARVLQLEPLNAADMRILLGDAPTKPSAEDVDAVIGLSCGSIGFALKILRADALPLYREMLAILNALPEMDVASMHKLADQMSRKADAETFDVLKTLLIERLRVATRDEAQKTPTGRPDLAMEIWEKTRSTFAAAEFSNLDKKLAFINALSDIRAAMI